jgi:hypothetical protein
MPTLNRERKTNAASDKRDKTILCQLRAFPLRFQRKVQIDHDKGCWIWTGATHFPPGFPEYSYGIYSVDGTPKTLTSAHRFAYEFVNGPLLPGLRLDLDHSCEVKLCVNPAHVGPMTHQDNCRLRRKRKRVPGSKRWFSEQNKESLI